MVEEYEKLEGRVMMRKNEKYVPDSTVISFAVYDLWRGKKVDSYFLYATDYVTFSEPFARLMVPCDGDDIVVYESMKENLFSQKCEMDKTVEMERLYEDYAEAYMTIRKFAFQERLADSEKMKLKEYVDIFHRITQNNFSAYYGKLAENFMRWAGKQLK